MIGSLIHLFCIHILRGQCDIVKVTGLEVERPRSTIYILYVIWQVLDFSGCHYLEQANNDSYHFLKIK